MESITGGAVFAGVAGHAAVTVSFHPLFQDLVDPVEVPFKRRMILKTPPRPQPHDLPAHAQRPQIGRELALYSQFVEHAGIVAGGLVAFEVKVSLRHPERPPGNIPAGGPLDIARAES
jgi:hypothetical protein